MRGRTALMLSALLLCLSLGCHGKLAVQETELIPQEPGIQNPGLPKPPAWTPPQTTLPKEFVEGVVFLLERGFADPRGGKFSKATVTSFSPWDGGGKPIEVEGWLLPEVKEKPRQIILPNGLAYEAISVLGDADVNSLKPKSNESLGIDHFQTIHSKVAALLLAGETSLAEAVYATRPKSNEQRDFLNLANAYLVARFHRAVEAHMQGNDALALSDAQALEAGRSDIEAKAQLLIGRRDLEMRAEYNPGKKIMAFPFLDPLDTLLEDTRRRVQDGPKKPLDLEVLKKLPQSDRIAKLIENLDEVSARQWGQPGGVSMGNDPIVAALVQEGEAAVEPLIDVAEKDKRLTRSVGFGRDFFPPRNLIAVKDVATFIVGQIYQTNVFVEKDGSIDLDALRKYARENKGLTPAERWYATLNDDTAGREKWVSAATQLVESPAVKHLGNGWQTVAPEADKTMKGEPLRRRTPSISSLMDKRAKQLVQEGERNSSLFSHELSEALQIGLCLHKWEPKAALPTLQWVSEEAMKPYDSLQVYVFQNCAQRLGEATMVRMQLGDKGALEPFGDWLMRMKFDDTGRDVVRALAPIAEQPDDPKMEALAKRLFTDPASPWNLLDIQKRNGLQKAENVMLSPLLANKTVVSSVEEVLKNRTVVGTTWWDRNAIHYQVQGGASGSATPADKDDPLRPKEGARVDLRVCDKLAMSLSRIQGAPDFKPYWPVPAKDKAIKQLAAYIKANRTRIKDLLPWPDNWSSPRH